MTEAIWCSAVTNHLLLLHKLSKTPPPHIHPAVLFLLHLFSDPKQRKIYCFVSMATQKLESSESPNRICSTECYAVRMRKVLKLDHWHCQLFFPNVVGQAQFNSGQTQHFSFILTKTRLADMRSASAEETGLPSGLLLEASRSSNRWLAQRKLTETGK